MRKSLASMLLAAAPVLILSACNSAGGNNGVSALPNAASVAQAAHSRMRPNDFSSSDLHAGGATFPAYAYNLGIQPTGCALTGCSAAGPGAPPALPQAPPGKGSLFAAAHTSGTIYYCLTGSGDGRKAFYGGSADATFPPFGPCAPLGATATGFGGRQDPLDFVGSDIALASTEYVTYAQNRLSGSETWGQPFEFPVIGGPIVYSYRPQDFKKHLGVKKIRLSTWTYCAIANGTISNWNDPAITSDNGNTSVTGGNNQTITFYFRSDGSGTTYNYTTHLAAACGSSWPAPYNAPPYQNASTGRNAAWTFGANQYWPGPGCLTGHCPGSVANPNVNFIGENGNPGVLAAIQSTPFGTGYLEGAWAKSASPPVSQALLQSSYGATSKVAFVDPTDKTAVEASFKNVTATSIQYGMGSDGVSFGSVTPADTRLDCVLYIDAATTLQNTPYKAYPIIAVSYMMFYGQNNNFHTTDKEKLIKFMTSTKANTIINNLEYIALSPSIHTAVNNALAGKGNSPSPCLQ